MTYTVFIDGSGKGNYAVLIIDSNNGEKVLDGFKEQITNNQAEYEALLLALNNLQNDSEAKICSDSQVLIGHMTGMYNIKNDELREYVKQAKNLIYDKGLKVEFKWVNRKRNRAGRYLG